MNCSQTARENLPMSFCGVDLDVNTLSWVRKLKPVSLQTLLSSVALLCSQRILSKSHGQFRTPTLHTHPRRLTDFGLFFSFFKSCLVNSGGWGWGSELAVKNSALRDRDFKIRFECARPHTSQPLSNLLQPHSRRTPQKKKTSFLKLFCASLMWCLRSVKAIGPDFRNIIFSTSLEPSCLWELSGDETLLPLVAPSVPSNKVCRHGTSMKIQTKVANEP